MSTYLTSKADELKDKARELKSTATTQSTIELGSTENTDLKQGNNAQDKLGEKATQLQTKAEELYTKAKKLEDAANQPNSPLKDLSATAGLLKTAAKNDSTGLYKAANDLAGKSGQPAHSEADQVIQEFDEVEKQYDLLMKLAGDNGLTDRSEVTEVVKTYYAVKNTYYQMLITYRIKEKAHAFYGAAQALKTEAQRAGDDKPKLKALHTEATPQMGALVATANTLKDIALGAGDSQIVQYYLAVVDKYNTLADKSAFTEALDKKVPQVQNVTEKFEALQKSYVNVLRLRVQELAQKAQALYDKADALKDDRDLGTQANALREAASKPSTQGLKEKATDLVDAINSPDGDPSGTNARAVIEQFDTVTDKYKNLSSQQKYQQLLAAALEKIKQNPGTPSLDTDEEKVKDVYDASNDLKKVYDKILNVTKMKQPANNLNNAATALNNYKTVTNAKLFKDKYDNFGKIYNSISDDIKSNFQSDFESIKNVFYGDQLEKIQL